MISVPEALEILKENLPEPRTALIPLSSAFGYRLSREICAPEPSPRYTSSAMDGFAVQWQDVSVLTPEKPVCLNIVGESQAGIPFPTILGAGEAIRISTGAVIPNGADTVIRVEDTHEESTKIYVKKCKSQGQDIRNKGEEFQQGTPLFEKSQILKSREIALLSAVGVHQVPVYAAPQVALFITGTELARAEDKNIKDHQVRDSNTPMLRSTVLESGGEVVDCIHVEDNLDLTIASMQKALDQNCDIILCSGGVSVGRHDHVKDAAEALGFEKLFWKIRQKPGKPLFVAKKGRTLLFGLPGNPVSAFMCFQNFVLPTLSALQGVDFLNKKLSASAEQPILNQGQRTDFIRVTVSNIPNTVPTFTPIAEQGSHMLTSIVKADGYIALEPGRTINTGELAEVFLF